MTMDDTTRRDALRGGVAAALAGLGAALAAASKPRIAEAQGAGDVMQLNALLTAEYLAIKAYDAGAGILGSPPMGDPLTAAAPAALLVASAFRQHHRDHASRLVSLVMAANGTPASEAAAVFTPPTGFTGTVANVLRLGANAEKAAAVAYTKSINSISSAATAEVVAAIGGVESQHFIVLYLLAKGIVTPGMITMANAGNVVPKSFVDAVGSGTSGLESVMDFTYAPLMGM